jgi:hypothetical protein
MSGNGLYRHHWRRVNMRVWWQHGEWFTNETMMSHFLNEALRATQTA